MPDNRKKNNGKKGTSPIDPNFAHVQPQAVEIERVVVRSKTTILFCDVRPHICSRERLL